MSRVILALLLFLEEDNMRKKKIKLPIICKTESNAPLIITNIKDQVVLYKILEQNSKKR